MTGTGTHTLYLNLSGQGTRTYGSDPSWRFGDKDLFLLDIAKGQFVQLMVKKLALSKKQGRPEKPALLTLNPLTSEQVRHQDEGECGNNQIHEEEDDGVSHYIAELCFGHAQEGYSPEGLYNIRHHISPSISHYQLT